jgi:hypothetical protein
MNILFKFLRQLASHQAFIDGEVETGFIPVCPFGCGHVTMN